MATLVGLVALPALIISKQHYTFIV